MLDVRHPAAALSMGKRIMAAYMRFSRTVRSSWTMSSVVVVVIVVRLVLVHRVKEMEGVMVFDMLEPVVEEPVVPVVMGVPPKQVVQVVQV